MEAESTKSDPMINFLAWLDKNKTKVLGGIAVIAVVAAASAIYSWNKNSTEIKANDALFALPTGMQSRSAAKPSGDAFLKVAAEFPGSSAAERAELMGAGVLFSEGKYDKAQSAFEKFASDHGKSQLRSQAVFGVAACLEAQGKTDLALNKYQEITRDFRGENVAPLANLARARLLESQNKPAEALKIYSEMEASTQPSDMWRGEAAANREKLLVSHPELAKSASPADEQIIEVTTPPEGSTNAPKVRVLSNSPAAKP